MIAFSIDIEYSSKCRKQLRKVPMHIQESLSIWLFTVMEIGLAETRKLKGYHDEPPVRLSRKYRLFYSVLKTTDKILLHEVNKHEY